MRLLIYAPTYRRIADYLAIHAPSLDCVLVDEAGVLTLNGSPVSAEEAAVGIAWADGELFESPGFRAFMTATLKSPNLVWVQSGAAGVDHPIFASFAQKGARLTTSHGQAVGMADYVLSQVLDHFQRGPERRAAQSEGAWRRLPFREMMHTTWLIVGFGAIGQAVAQRAGAFGARILGMRRDQTPHPLAERIIPPEELIETAPEADVLVLCLPSSPATRHLAGPALFAAMKTGSVLVNVGRGAVVDEPALLAALDQGAPGHAVLDVFETEPLPADSLIWRHPRVVLTAHASGLTGGQHRRNQALFLDNLSRFLSHQPLLNEVPPETVLQGRAG